MSLQSVMALRESSSGANINIKIMLTSHALSRAIIDLVDSNNVSVFKGREATGFSNTEEEMINLVKV